MGFADKYLSRQKIYPDFISESPSKELRYIVVIPAYNEPDIISAIESLYNCIRPKFSVEIIIVINSSEISDENVKLRNINSIKELKDRESGYYDDEFKAHIIHVDDIPEKVAGAGMARKIGMDEAVSRFNYLNQDAGIIISYDADCTCDPNYLVEIEKTYLENKGVNTCTIYFEHPISGSDFDPELYKGITHYELYLRYYKHSLEFAQFPFAYYTIGSCFVVKASVYVSHGGMNKRNAGEDFYFLNKVFPAGGVVELNSTRVIPSPRSSDRVIFGTGKEIIKWMDSKKLEVYNFKAFRDLKSFLSVIEKFIPLIENKSDFYSLLETMPSSISEFLLQNDFYSEMKIINSDCKKPSTFIKRFYLWFDAFRVVKFLNFVHKSIYKKTPVICAAIEYLQASSDAVEYPEEAEPLLHLFRKIDRL